MMNFHKGAALFVGGVLFGSAGFKLLSSKDAKKAYTHMTAAALRVQRSTSSVRKRRRPPAWSALKRNAQEMREGPPGAVPLVLWRQS